MVRNVIAEEHLLSYLQSLAKTDGCVVGLILGQPTALRDYVVHMARTPQSSKKISDEITTEEQINQDVKTSSKSLFQEISEGMVGNHAKLVTRMLPGGMFVLGIFIVSDEDDLLTTQSIRIKSMLAQINKQLLSNPYLRGIEPDYVDKLVLIYNSKSNSYLCRSSNNATGSFRPLEFKFVSKPTKWHQLECNYQFDQNIPITSERINWNLQKHLEGVLASLSETLRNGNVMIDGEFKDLSDSIESLDKKKKNAKNKMGLKDVEDTKVLPVNIFIPCKTSNEVNDAILIHCSGNMHFVGQLTAKVFLHQKATVLEASNSIKDDIIRSLAARFDMHCGSLIDEDLLSPDEKYIVHEPPRRVFFTLPESSLSFSDYLFPGEGAVDALVGLSGLLDTNVDEKNVKIDVEMHMDPADIYAAEERFVNNTISEETAPIEADTNRLIYYAGLFVALIVLIASLLIHFLKQPF